MRTSNVRWSNQISPSDYSVSYICSIYARLLQADIDLNSLHCTGPIFNKRLSVDEEILKKMRQDVYLWLLFLFIVLNNTLLNVGEKEEDTDKQVDVKWNNMADLLFERALAEMRTKHDKEILWVQYWCYIKVNMRIWNKCLN